MVPVTLSSIKAINERITTVTEGVTAALKLDDLPVIEGNNVKIRVVCVDGTSIEAATFVNF